MRDRNGLRHVDAAPPMRQRAILAQGARMKGKRLGLLAGFALLASAICHSVPAHAFERVSSGVTAGGLDVSAQQRRERPPARITVTPRRSYTYPGPGAVRQCAAWLQPEYRPSGTVIVPQMHCWWERG